MERSRSEAGVPRPCAGFYHIQIYQIWQGAHRSVRQPGVLGLLVLLVVVAECVEGIGVDVVKPVRGEGGGTGARGSRNV